MASGTPVAVVAGELVDEASSAPRALAVRPSEGAPLVQVLVDGSERAKAYAAAARAPSTRRLYASQWKGFVAWCRARDRDPLPAPGAPIDGVLIATYLAALADGAREMAGIEVALSAIAAAYQMHGHLSPRDEVAVRETRKGIRNTIGTAQHGKAALTVEQLERAAASLPEGLAGVRDRALVALGFAGAFRRSELVGVNVEDLRTVPEGLEVQLHRSKTDQEGSGRVVPIPADPASPLDAVRLVSTWLAASGITEGPVFRRIDRWGNLGRARRRPCEACARSSRACEHLTDHHVAVVVKAAAIAAGVDPDDVAGHTLRASFATAAAAAGASERQIMATTGHKNVAMVQRYIRPARRFEDLAGPIIARARNARKAAVP
jgi:integrase